MRATTIEYACSIVRILAFRSNIKISIQKWYYQAGLDFCNTKMRQDVHIVSKRSFPDIPYLRLFELGLQFFIGYPDYSLCQILNPGRSACAYVKYFPDRASFFHHIRYGFRNILNIHKIPGLVSIPKTTGFWSFLILSINFVITPEYGLFGFCRGLKILKGRKQTVGSP